MGFEKRMARVFEVIVDASLQEQKLNAFVSPPLTLPEGGELRAQRGKARRTVDDLHQTCFSRELASGRYRFRFCIC